MCLGLQIFFVALFVGLVMAGVNVMPLAMDSLPLDIKDDVDYLRTQTWANKEEEENNIVDRLTFSSTEAERSQINGQILLVFQKKKGNVFTKENLMAIQEVERELYNEPVYQSKYCSLRSGTCQLPLSILRYFDGSKAHINGTFNDTNFDNIVNVLYMAKIHEQTARSFESYIHIDSEITAEKAVSEITKVSILFGGPLEGYANLTDREDDQFDEVKDYINDKVYKKLDKYFNDGVGEMNCYYLATHIFGDLILRQVLMDLTLAFIGLIIVFIIMCIQTRSLWVTGWALLSVLTGFFIAILIYRFIFDYRYVGIFHVLSIFIMLGIGADDVFVFYDTWKQSGCKKFKSLAHRLSYTYRKASLAMLFTSLTTATAFIMSATSPFLAVSSFGVFAGLLVLVNYCSVITFFPAVVITYHNWFANNKCCCCCTRETVPEGEQQDNMVVRFFDNYYFRFITNNIARICIFLVFTGLIIMFIFFITKLEADDEEVIKYYIENTL